MEREKEGGWGLALSETLTHSHAGRFPSYCRPAEPRRAPSASPPRPALQGYAVLEFPYLALFELADERGVAATVQKGKYHISTAFVQSTSAAVGSRGKSTRRTRLDLSLPPPLALMQDSAGPVTQGGGCFAEDGCNFLCPSWSLGQRDQSRWREQ